MTHDELREKVARAICRGQGLDPDMLIKVETFMRWMPQWKLFLNNADAAIAICMEEAARVVERMSGSVRQGNIAALYIPPTAKDAAAAIRALISSDASGS